MSERDAPVRSLRGPAAPVLEVQRLGGAAIVRVPRTPPASAHVLPAAVDELIGEGCTVLVVDLHDLEVLSPAGVAALRCAARAAALRDVWLRIIADSPGVVEPLLGRVDSDPLDVTDTSGAHRRPARTDAPIRPAEDAVAS
jgi:anti-anti-sigma regulatory factor